MTPRKKQTGFTLVELMFTIALAAILLGFAVPAIRDGILSNRLNSATSAVYELFTEARSLAMQKNQDVYLSFSTESSGSQCVGYNVGTPCDCATGTCQKVVSDGQFANITFNQTRGDPTTPAFTPYGWILNYWRIQVKAWKDSAQTNLARQHVITVTKTGMVVRSDI